MVPPIKTLLASCRSKVFLAQMIQIVRKLPMYSIITESKIAKWSSQSQTTCNCYDIAKLISMIDNCIPGENKTAKKQANFISLSSSHCRSFPVFGDPVCTAAGHRLFSHPSLYPEHTDRYSLVGGILDKHRCYPGESVTRATYGPYHDHPELRG